jgi:hypothetical protein
VLLTTDQEETRRMLIYDDTAAPVVQNAAEEARRLGAAAYDTQHLLVSLVSADDPVTHRVTEAAPQLTPDAVRGALTEGRPAPIAAGTPRQRPPTPAREYGRAMSDFTATWGRLIKAGHLPRRPRFSSAELWLVALQPAALSARLLQSLGVDPRELRAVVLATMVEDGQPVPAWPEPAPRGHQPFVARVLRWGRARP